MEYGQHVDPSKKQLPLHIISIIRGEEPAPSLLKSVNLLTHFLMAFLLALTAYIFLTQLGFRPSVAFTFSIIPIVLELLLPAPLYWHQNVYFADQAVLIPFILFVLLEIVRDGIESRKTLTVIGVCQAALLFYGTLTDWLFIFIALTVYIKRVMTRENAFPFKTFCKKSVGLWLPSILALSLFIVQLYSLKVLPRIVDRFLLRIGVKPTMSEISGINEGFFTLFWPTSLVSTFEKIR